MTIEEIKESPSYRALMDFWEQRDEDGIIIGVSRQALVETLQLFEEATQTSQEREREIVGGVINELKERGASYFGTCDTYEKDCIACEFSNIVKDITERYLGDDKNK